MNQVQQEKLEVSRQVVEQLNGMVRNGAASNPHGPDTAPGPGPAPNTAHGDYED
jgi:hypothetical protein